VLGGRRKTKSAADRSAPSIKAIAVRLLARREYGRAELGARLRARGGAEEEVERTLDELTALGYLSDARSAEALVRSRTGQFSRRAIAHALKERRIADDAAQAALAPLAGRDEMAEATALWTRRFGTPPRNERDKARHVRFLLSRGYSLSIALKVLRRAGAHAAPEADDPA
jgi:regulatory protein